MGDLQAKIVELEAALKAAQEELQGKDVQGKIARLQAALKDSESGCAVFEMSDGTLTTHDPANGIWCVSLADMLGGACLSESADTDARFTIDSPSGTFAGTSIHFRSGSLDYVDQSTSALVSDAGNPAPPRGALRDWFGNIHTIVTGAL